MPVYNFAFPAEAAGLTCTVKDDGGTTVHSATLGAALDDNGAIPLQVTLPEGDYVGSAKTVVGGGITSRWQSVGVLDIPDSIAAGGGGAGNDEPATITGAWEFTDLSVRSPDETAHPLTVENDGTIVSSHGPTTDENIIVRFDADGEGTPIEADAGYYELVGRVIQSTIRINYGDDQAAIQAAFDALLLEAFGASGTFTATVTGDWSLFTVESDFRAIFLHMGVAANQLTLLGEPVAWPWGGTNIVEGHGTYVEMPGLYGQILGRATAETPWDGWLTLFDPTSEHYADAGWVRWAWYHGSQRGVSDQFGGTTDRMDVQRHAIESQTERHAEVNVQAYGDDRDADESVAVYMTAQINKDGTGRDVHLRGMQNDVTGFYELTISDATVQALLRANPDQTDSVLVVQDETGAPVFEVAPDGAPILRSPNGTAYRLVVANDGTLSTEAV